MAMLHEFNHLTEAEVAHARFKRLNRGPFSIFKTARGTWAFWTPF